MIFLIPSPQHSIWFGFSLSHIPIHHPSTAYHEKLKKWTEIKKIWKYRTFFIFFEKVFEIYAFSIFKIEFAIMYQKWKSQKIDDVLKIDRSLLTSEKIEKRFRIFSSIFIHIRTWKHSTQSSNEFQQIVFSFNIIVSRFSAHSNSITGSVQTDPPIMFSIIENNFINLSFSFSKNIRKNFFFNTFSMSFSAKSIFKSRKETFNQSLSIFSGFSFEFFTSSTLSFHHDRIQCVYSSTLSTISIDLFIAIGFLFKDSQSFMTIIERFQKISIFQSITFFQNNFQSTFTVFAQNSESVFAIFHQTFGVNFSRKITTHSRTILVFSQSILLILRFFFQMPFLQQTKLSSRIESEMELQLSKRVIDFDEWIHYFKSSDVGYSAYSFTSKRQKK